MNLTPKEIAYLLPSFTEKTAISLFSNIKATPDGTEHDSLIQKGVIQGNGYAPDALELLLQIANPKRCARVIIKNEFFTVEKYTYWNSGKMLLADNKSGEFVFRKIENLGDVTIGLSELFSMSSIKTAEVSVSLPINEMMVLMAVIDLYRRNTLLNYAGKSNPAESVSEQEIVAEMTEGFDNGLAKVFLRNFDKVMPEAKDAGHLLAGLVEKKCLSLGQGYRLTENYALLARNFLLLNSVILYEAFEVLPNGDVPMDGGLSVAAGIHDIITFVNEGETIGLYSFSAFQLLETIEKILSCPALADEAKQIIPPPPVTAPFQGVPPPPVQPMTQQPVHQPAFQQPQPMAQPVHPTPAQPIPGNTTWQCACGRVNKANFCASCGRRKI